MQTKLEWLKKVFDWSLNNEKGRTGDSKNINIVAFYALNV